MNTKNTNLPETSPLPFFQFRLEPTWEQKLEILGGGASDDVACQTCASNPNAGVVTHRANQPIAATDLQPRPRDLRPWLSSSIRSDGKRVPIVKTLVVQSKSKYRTRLFEHNPDGSQHPFFAARHTILEKSHGI